jgi:hypothetical protein
MASAPGQDPGHIPAGFTWGDYVEFLVASCGSLAAAAERLSARRGYKEDIATIERALRRLRSRGQAGGGTWGARALAVFGLPAPADARTRWMGAYHSRFTDLPVPICLELVRVWDRPPISELPDANVWLALARATCALRGGDLESAAVHVQRARASARAAPAEARAELVLTEAFIASRVEGPRVSALLLDAEPILREPMGAADRACLHARWIDQRAYELNQGRAGAAPDLAGAEALYRSLPEDGAPAFARCRRANGLAYARWKQGFAAEGAAFAREACRHAGDGGHLRMRAMALTMLARIVGGDEGAAARTRAVAIARDLDDEALRIRFERRALTKSDCPSSTD